MNTKFFHLMVKWRSRKNEIKGLFIDDQWVEEPEVVKNNAMSYFENRFQEQSMVRPKLDGAQFKSISLSQNEMLVTVFGEEEIKGAV
uniref:Uncharacterized protein n=1 Tax=Cajanus cajan TaxID=3821 RepID=A0A151SBV6_CAJCA|nr:hypothetical protein KK1_025880 [Cajanus cajan]